MASVAPLCGDRPTECSIRELERIYGLDDAYSKRRAFRWELAAFRFKSALLRYVGLGEKAGFRQDQPRWPKGSGDDSGRWSGGSGTPPPGVGQNPVSRPKGHHFVPNEVFADPTLRLRPETRKVFEQGVTGPLKGGPHQWSKEHQIYNDAVQEHLDRFLAKNRIASYDMTPDDARKFLNEIKEARDPRIRNFNMKIYIQEFRYYLRRIPGRQD